MTFQFSVTEAVSNLRQILIKISNENLKKTELWADSKRKPRNNYAPWMNDQSKQSKAKLNRARKKYQNAIGSDRTTSYLLKFREEYLKTRKEHQYLCKKLEKQCWKQQKNTLYEMRSQDPKEFWKCLNLKPKSKSQNFSKDKLFEFFQNLAADEDTCTTESEPNEPHANSELTENVDSILNNKISLEEAKQMLKS